MSAGGTEFSPRPGSRDPLLPATSACSSQRTHWPACGLALCAPTRASGVHPPRVRLLTAPGSARLRERHLHRRHRPGVGATVQESARAKLSSLRGPAPPTQPPASPAAPMEMTQEGQERRPLALRPDAGANATVALGTRLVRSAPSHPPPILPPHPQLWRVPLCSPQNPPGPGEISGAQSCVLPEEGNLLVPPPTPFTSSHWPPRQAAVHPPPHCHRLLQSPARPLHLQLLTTSLTFQATAAPSLGQARSCPTDALGVARPLRPPQA